MKQERNVSRFSASMELLYATTHGSKRKTYNKQTWQRPKSKQCHCIDYLIMGKAQ